MSKGLSTKARNTDFTKPESNRRRTEKGIPPELESGRRPGDNHTYCTFYLLDQLMGVAIDKVQDVLTAQQICRVPLATESVAGLLNLRGQIVTAINLRERLGLPPQEDTEDVMNIVVEDQEELFSFIVDKVGDVIEVRKDAFEPPPATLKGSLRQCCEGVYRLKNELLVILSVPLILDVEQF